MIAGKVVVEWRPGFVLEVARIREAVLHWRGGVRFGGAEVTLVGRLETTAPKTAGNEGSGGTGVRAPRPSSTLPLLRATGTNQPFRLRTRAPGIDPALFRPDQSYRVTGQILNTGGDKNHEIVLEVERAEPIDGPR